MKQIKTSNRKCNKLVALCIPFVANNIFAQNWPQDFYVVFSYGTHWPLFAYDKRRGVWYANSSKYGRTTSKHYGQAYPARVDNLITIERNVLYSALSHATDIRAALDQTP
jgi:hypothetical protein